MTKFPPAANGAGSRVPWPPDPFSYSDGCLCVGGLPLEEVVAATGTPAYVYDLDAVAAAYRRAAAAFEPIGGRVLYAVKANATLAVLATLADLGAGFDVVSGGELVRVLRAGGDPASTVFASVGKTAHELALAVGHGVTVHVESADELEALEAVAARLERPASFAVRVNPDVEVDTHVNIQTGHDEAKFGVPVAVATELLGRAARGELPWCRPVGVHVHVGSQLPDPEGVAEGARVGLGVLEAGRPGWSSTGWTWAGACRSTTAAGRPPAPSCSRPPWPRWSRASRSGWPSSPAGPWSPGPAPWSPRSCTASTAAPGACWWSTPACTTSCGRPCTRPCTGCGRCGRPPWPARPRSSARSASPPTCSPPAPTCPTWARATCSPSSTPGPTA